MITMIPLTTELHRLRVLGWKCRSGWLLAECLRRFSAAAAASSQMLLPESQDKKAVLGIPVNNNGSIHCIIGGTPNRGLDPNFAFSCRNSSSSSTYPAAAAIPSFDYEKRSFAAAAEILVSVSSSVEETASDERKSMSENLSNATKVAPPMLCKVVDDAHREFNRFSLQTGVELDKWRRRNSLSSSSSVPARLLNEKAAHGSRDDVQEHCELINRRRQHLSKRYSNSGSSSSEAITKSGSGGAPRNLRLRASAADAYWLNRRISLLMDLGYHDEAYAVYEEMLLPVSPCKPDSYTYLHLIKGYCKAGKLAEARKLFRKVIITKAEELHSSGGGSKSELILYNVMIHGLGTAGYVNEAMGLMQEMTHRGCSPDIYSYNSIVHSLGKAGKADDALAVFQSMAGMGCTPDLVTYNSIICALGKAGRVQEASAVYELMIKSGFPPDSFTFNTLLSNFGKWGQLNLAIELYNSMKLVGYQPDVYTYSSLVATLCQEGRVDEALRFSLEMTERGCPPNTATFNSWINGLCKSSRVIDAHLLFVKMVQLGYVPDNITYCILIDASCKHGGQFLDQSFTLLKDLVRRRSAAGGSLDHRTSEIVFHSFKKVGMLKQAKRITRNARAKQSRRLIDKD